MRNKKLLSLIIIGIVLNICPTFSATVIKKEDAGLFSKKSIYSDTNVQETVISKGNVDENTGIRQNDDAINKFSCVTATKNGKTYTNIWSNYSLTFDDDIYNANDTYDFNSEGMKYDLGVYFNDYSRIAIYYSRLSRDLNVVAANFAPGSEIEDEEIAGETYKHVSLDVPYPYGVEKYDYYLRAIDGKLMVIELYWEEGYDKCKKYIDEIERLK